MTWGQNSREVLDKMAEVFSGLGANPCIYNVPAKPPRRPNKSYILNVTHRKYVRAIIEAMLPHMIVKRADAIALLEWMDTNPKRANCEPVDETELKRLHAEGFTQTAIAKQLGYGTSKIGKECRRLGLTFVSGGRCVGGKRIPKRSREEHLAARAAIERKPCPSCGTKIYLASKRCRPCAIKHRTKRSKRES